MFLRDYLYVDIDKVHGLATQIYDGVPEKSSDLAARQSELGVDLKLLKGSRVNPSKKLLINPRRRRVPGPGVRSGVAQLFERHIARNINPSGLG